MSFNLIHWAVYIYSMAALGAVQFYDRVVAQLFDIISCWGVSAVHISLLRILLSFFLPSCCFSYSVLRSKHPHPNFFRSSNVCSSTPQINKRYSKLSRSTHAQTCMHSSSKHDISMVQVVIITPKTKRLLNWQLSSLRCFYKIYIPWIEKFSLINLITRQGNCSAWVETWVSKGTGKSSPQAPRCSNDGLLTMIQL